MIPLVAEPAAPERPPRPANTMRTVYHVANAVMVLILAHMLDTRLQRVGLTGLALVVAWSMEGARRIWPAARAWWDQTFGPLIHPNEVQQVTSATWYVTALVLLAALFPLEAGVAGIAVLGAGDPVAALIGRRFGRIRILSGRTLEGSIAFVAAGSIAAWATLACWHPTVGELPVLAVAAAVGGAAGELISTKRLDDNLMIPLSAAAALWLARWMGA